MFQVRIFLVIFALAFVGVIGVSAQGGDELISNDPPYPCPYTDSAFFQPNVFPRYDINADTLVLVNAVMVPVTA